MAIYKGQWEDNKTGNVLYPHTSTDVVFNSAGKNVDALLNEKSNSNHTHDDRYYTESEMDTKLNVKLNTTGNASNVTNTFTQATTLANLTTGEKLSVSLGKVMKAITDLISHISNKSNPHAVTKAQVGLGNVTNDAQVKRSEMGVANGVATLDTTGKVPSSQLPSYVDDVLEYTNKSSFPATGEAGKIYVDKTTNKTYRWSGTAYVEISSSLALGETASTAYSGDKGKATTDNVNAILAGTKVVPKATDANTLDGKDSTAFANATHKHTKAQITDFPTSMKNPTSMKIQLNGGTTEGNNQFTYDGSVAKNVNITPAGIGASPSNHNHNTLYSKITDGSGALYNGTITPNDNLLTNSDFRSGIINQQAINSYIYSNKSMLTIDRWISYGVNVNVDSKSITMANRTSAPHSVQQPLYTRYKSGDKVTLYISAFNITGNVYVYVTGLDAQKKKLVNGDNVFTFTLTSELDRFFIYFEVNAVASFNCLKLEHGEHFTGMPLWNETLELIKCKEYFDVRNVVLIKLPTYASSITEQGNKFIVSNLDNIFNHDKQPSVSIISAKSPTDSVVNISGATLALGKQGLYTVTLTSNTSYTYLQAVIHLDWNNY